MQSNIRSLFIAMVCYPQTREYVVYTNSPSMSSTASIIQDSNQGGTEYIFRKKYARKLLCSCLLVLIIICFTTQFVILVLWIESISQRLHTFIQTTNVSAMGRANSLYGVTINEKNRYLEKQDTIAQLIHAPNTSGQADSNDVSETFRDFQTELEEMQLNQEISDSKIDELEQALYLTIQELNRSKTTHEYRLGVALNLLNKVAMRQNLDKDDLVELDEDWTVDVYDKVDIDTDSLEDLTCHIDKVVKMDNNEVNCNASSELSSHMGCEKAFDNVLAIGRSGSSTWESKGEGKGAWIQAKFKSVKIVKVVKILQRHSKMEAVKDVELEFDGGAKQIAKLLAKDDHHWNVIKLTHGISTKTIKIKILSVYKAVNVGFKEIEIYTC